MSERRGRKLEEIFEFVNKVKDVGEFMQSSSSPRTFESILNQMLTIAAYDYFTKFLEERTAGLEEKLERRRGESEAAKLELAKYLADLPEEKRREVLKMYSMVKSIDSRDPSAVALALGLMGHAAARTPEEKAEITRLVKRALKRIEEKVGGGGTQQQDLLIKMFDVFKDVFSKYVDEQVKAREELKSALQGFASEIKSALENINRGSSIDEAIKLLEKVHELGGKVGLVPSKEYLRHQLELEKLKTLKELKEKEVEAQKYVAELERSQKVKESEAFSKAIDELAEAAIKAMSEVEASEKQAPPVRIVACPKCGKEVAVAPGTKVARCLNCGEAFELQVVEG